MNAPILIYLCLAWFLHSYRIQEPCLGNGAAHRELDITMSINLINRILHSHNHRPSQCKQLLTEILCWCVMLTKLAIQCIKKLLQEQINSQISVT